MSHRRPVSLLTVVFSLRPLNLFFGCVVVVLSPRPTREASPRPPRRPAPHEARLVGLPAWVRSRRLWGPGRTLVARQGGVLRHLRLPSAAHGPSPAQTRGPYASLPSDRRGDVAGTSSETSPGAPAHPTLDDLWASAAAGSSQSANRGVQRGSRRQPRRGPPAHGGRSADAHPRRGRTGVVGGASGTARGRTPESPGQPAHRAGPGPHPPRVRSPGGGRAGVVSRGVESRPGTPAP